VNLLGKPPLGQKAPKPPKKPRKALPRQSKKRRAYLASDDRKAGLAHMQAVAGLCCLVCGVWPVEVHHEGKPRSDMRCLPLCAAHHRREFGAGALHYSPRAFYALHGDSETLLKRVEAMLQRKGQPR